MIDLPITKTARRWGYVSWGGKKNDMMRNFVNGADRVRVYLNGSELGMKNIDWKYSRISLGYALTRRFPEDASKYILDYNKKTKELLIVSQ